MNMRKIIFINTDTDRSWSQTMSGLIADTNQHSSIEITGFPVTSPS